MGIFTSRVWPEPLTALREELETWTLENHSVLRISFKSLIVEVSTHPKCACGSTLFTNAVHPGIFEMPYTESHFNPSAPSRRYSKISVIWDMEIFIFPPVFTHWHSTTVCFFIFVGFFVAQFPPWSWKELWNSEAKAGRKGSRSGYLRSYLHIQKAGQHFLKQLKDLINQFPKKK